MKNITSKSSIPQSKLGQIRDLVAAGDMQQAIRIAARFPRLPADQRAAILDAHTAYTNPRFLAQLGRCVETAKADGHAALVAAYKLSDTPQS